MCVRVCVRVDKHSEFERERERDRQTDRQRIPVTSPSLGTEGLGPSDDLTEKKHCFSAHTSETIVRFYVTTWGIILVEVILEKSNVFPKRFWDTLMGSVSYVFILCPITLLGLHKATYAMQTLLMGRYGAICQLPACMDWTRLPCVRSHRDANLMCIPRHVGAYIWSQSHGQLKRE